MRSLWLLLLFSLPIHAETLIEIGPSQVGDTYSNSYILTLTERVNDKYDFTLGMIGNQTFQMCERDDCIWEVDKQIFFGADLLVKPLWFWTDRIKFGIGPYAFARPDRIVSSFLRVGLSLEWAITDRIALRARHWSVASAGIQRLDFCNRDRTFCDRREFNNGQDSWLRLQWRF